LDLYVLMTHHGYTFPDYVETFRLAKMESSIEQAMGRLCSGMFDPEDPGYQSLLQHPPTPEEMQTFFSGQRNQYEQQCAQDALSTDPRPEPPGRA
jgi:hypothetical protein